MARTGKFGRAPRTAPSLTATIIAIAREYQQQRDSNIMDAWQKGGTFEGKKVTDALVLQHWRDRAAGVSPDDPLHDTYMNAVTNLDYTIHESKMTAQYALGKVNDGAMVSFYLGWAKKVPKDSEFYRVLQRDAGQYMRSARNLSQAKINAAKEQKYQSQQAETQSKYEAAAEFLTDTIRRMNQSGYTPANPAAAGAAVAPTIGAPGSGSDLTDFDPRDPETSMKLLALIAPYAEGSSSKEVAPGVYMPEGAPQYKGNTAVLYHNDDKKPITGADVIAQLTKLDPSYKPGQPIDIAYLTGLLDKENQGLQERIDRATATGHMQDAAQLQKSKAYVATLNREVAAWPIEKAYQDLRQTFDHVRNDPTASPQAVMNAWETYKSGLLGLSNSKAIAADDNTRARLVAEANGQTGVPTLAESFTGLQTGAYDQTSAKDSANTAAQIAFLQGQIDSVNKSAALPNNDPNKFVWTYGKTGSDGVFVPDPNGTEVGSATIANISAHGQMPQTVTVEDPRGGQGIQMTVTAVPVYGVAKDPVTGKNLPTTNDQPIAWAYNMPNGGQNALQYGYLVKDPSDPTKSVMHFSADQNPPWADNLKITPSSSGGNHYEVDFSPLLPTAASTSGGAPGSTQLNIDLRKEGAVAGLPGFTVQDVGKPTNANPSPTGTLTWDPYTFARSSDTTRSGLGGTDPMTDFSSLTVSNLLTSTDGQTILRSLDQHPEFKAQVTNDANSYAGVQYDPKTGIPIPGTGDQNKLNAANQQTNLAQDSKNFIDFITKGAQTWQRLTTGSPYPGVQTGPSAGPSAGQGAFGPTGFQKLATDLVKGTPFENIAKNLLPGTLTQQAPQGSTVNDQTGFTIKTGTGLTIPGMPGPAQVKRVTTNDQKQGAMGGSTSTQQTGTQTGATAPTAATSYSGNGAKKAL